MCVELAAGVVLDLRLPGDEFEVIAKYTPPAAVSSGTVPRARGVVPKQLPEALKTFLKLPVVVRVKLCFEARAPLLKPRTRAEAFEQVVELLSECDRIVARIDRCRSPTVRE
jgi:hypothetical protein